MHRTGGGGAIEFLLVMVDVIVGWGRKHANRQSMLGEREDATPRLGRVVWLMYHCLWFYDGWTAMVHLGA